MTLGGNGEGERITCSAKLRDRVVKSMSSKIGRMAVGEVILAGDSRLGLRVTEDF